MGEAEMASRGRVYFLRSQSQDAVKVGFTKGAVARRHTLQTGNPAPLYLLIDIQGSKHVELAIHEALSDFRIAGEWYRDDGLFSPVFIGDVGEAAYDFEIAEQETDPDEMRRVVDAAVAEYRSWVVRGRPDGEDA